MPGGRPVGTIYAEVGLDYTPYTRAQKRLLKDATTTTLNIEKSYKDLRIKSSAEFDLMRAKAHNAYFRIANDAKTSASDIVRAEKAKNEQLRKINEMQYGSQVTMLQRMGKLWENWGGRVTAIISGIVIAKGLSKLSEYTTRLIKDSTLLAARYETLGVVMTVVGRNVGMGADEMQRLQKELMKTGISAIESRQNLVRMSQANIDLSQATKLARIAQDAAVIGMVNSSEAFNKMIYGIQTGQIRVLRTIGLNVNFEQSYKKLAAQLGKTTDDLTNYEKMQARVNTVMEAGKNITGAYEASMTTASKQMYSLQRYTENLKVAFGEAFRPAFSEIIRATTDAIKKMTVVVNDPQFRESLSNIASGFGQIVVQLMNLAKYANLKSIIGTTQEAGMLEQLGYSISGFSGMDLLGQQKAVDQMKEQLNITSEMLKQMDEIRQAESKLSSMKESQGKYFFSRISSEDISNQQKLISGLKDELKWTQQLAEEKAQEFMASEVYTDQYKVQMDTRAKALYAQRKAEEKAEAERIKNAKLIKDLEDKRIKDAVKGSGAMMDAWVGYQTLTIESANETALALQKLREKEQKEEEKSASDRARAYRSMYKDMKDTGYANFGLQVELLKKQRDEYIKFTHDKVTAEKWFSEQYEKLLIEQYQKSDNFIKGVTAGFLELKRNQYTWGQAGYDIVKKFSDSSTSHLADFFNFTKDGFLDLDSLAKGIFDDMVSAWSQMLARMINQWVMSGIGGLLTGQGFSGFNMNALIGGGSNAVGIGSAIGATGALSGVGASSGMASVGVGATATEIGGAGFEAYSVASGATSSTASTATLSSGATLGIIAGGILAAPVLGSTITSAIQDIFSSKTAPTGAEYIQAYLAGVPPGTALFGEHVMPSQAWFDKDSNVASQLSNWPYNSGWMVSSNSPLIDMIQNREVAYDEIYSLIKRYGQYEDPTAHQFGGMIDKVFKPFGIRPGKGDDGFVSAQIGEGMLSKKGIENLGMLNSGNMSGTMRIEIPLMLKGRELTRAVAEFGPKDVEYVKMTRKVAQN